MVLIGANLGETSLQWVPFILGISGSCKTAQFLNIDYVRRPIYETKIWKGCVTIKIEMLFLGLHKHFSGKYSYVNWRGPKKLSTCLLNNSHNPKMYNVGNFHLQNHATSPKSSLIYYPPSCGTVSYNDFKFTNYASWYINDN